METSTTTQSGGNHAAAVAAATHTNPAHAIRFTVKSAFGCQPTRIDPLVAFSASSGNKDYSDRLLHKVGKQLSVFDPETGSQEFFENRSRNVIDVTHFSTSANQRFVAMCEAIRHDKASSDAGSQVSVYSLSTFNRLKTLHHSLPRPYVCATFCGDPKLVAALSDEPDRHIVIWQWEKEKVHKVVHVHVHATLLRSAPSNNLMLTTSGTGALKHWTLAPDGTLKHGNMLPTAKESLDVYTDHCWLPSTHSQHRMIVLVDPDSSNDINRHRKQAIYIFEGVDNEVPSSNLPLLMEMRQTIQLKLDQGCRVEKLVPSLKAFSVVGMGGYFAAFERTDDKAEPYVESRRLALGDKHLIGGCVYPSEEKMVLLTKQGRLLSMPLDATIEQIKKAMGGTQDDAESVHSKEEGHRSLVPSLQSGGISDLRAGGHHTSSILAADMAFERPLLVTVGADNTARVWNYLTSGDGAEKLQVPEVLARCTVLRSCQRN
ncbi:hypothetical protein EON64_08320 [archaeon]|nr:MAG: hypothetical protein EON64_08320 [archaeon]